MSTNQPVETVANYKLTTKNLFNHFLLVHDFLYKFTRTKAENGQYLDAQVDVQSIMNRASANGGRFGQIAALGLVTAYCLKGNNVTFKFIAGFLYVYWLNHSYTMGQYLGVLIKMPRAYRRIGEYYQKHPQHPNLLDKFEGVMQEQTEYEDTQLVLKTIFPQQYENNSSNYISNEYFIKNKEKYNLENDAVTRSLKLPYFDSFLTRYAYYSYIRWLHRLKLFLGIAQE